MKKGLAKQNILTGSIWRGALLFALPLAGTGILQQLFNAADLAVVGRFTGTRGTAAMAAVGVCGPIVNLLVNLFVGLALGANVVIARAIGAGDRETVHRAVHTSVTFAVIAGVCATVAGEIAAPPLLHLISVPDEVMPMATLYMRIYFLGLPIILLYNYQAAIFRAVGDTRTPLLVLACSGLVNVGLNLLFVVGFGLAVEGVAIATVLANLLSASLLATLLHRAQGDIHLDFRKLGIHWPTFKRILRIGLPAGLQSAVFSVSNIIISSAINSLDTVVMAASSAAFNVEIFAYFALNSFSQACTTFVSQNYGARQLDRCKKAFGVCVAEDFICVAIFVTVILTFGRHILAIFNKDPVVIEIGYVRLTYILLSYGFSMLYENAAGYLRGFGVAVTPAVLTMLGVCGVRIFWVYAIFPRAPLFTTIMTVYPVSLGTTAALMVAAVLIVRPARRRAAELKLAE